MKPLLLILFAFSATAFCTTLPAPPSPGTYVGRLTVTKVLPADGLSSRYTLRVQAKVLEQGANIQTTVSADGTTTRTDQPITILTTVPESPVAAANVERTVTRVTRVITHTPPPPMVLSNNTSITYHVDGKPVEVFALSGSLLKITYRNPPAPADPGAPQPNYTSFEFVLRKVSE